ncbi:MAG: hypothetical protein QGH52_06365, partial [Prochlorococcaceae cyanobacterium ETNP1_MAG_8]|nr:hypothetical protein [Prochlorococcaceae cyanobacterium ETNP1_MAG_8]
SILIFCIHFPDGLLTELMAHLKGSPYLFNLDKIYFFKDATLISEGQSISISANLIFTGIYINLTT